MAVVFRKRSLRSLKSERQFRVAFCPTQAGPGATFGYVQRRAALGHLRTHAHGFTRSFRRRPRPDNGLSCINHVWPPSAIACRTTDSTEKATEAIGWHSSRGEMA